MIERTEKNVFSQSRDSRWKEIETAFFIVVLKIFSVNSVVVYIVFFFFIYVYFERDRSRIIVISIFRIKETTNIHQNINILHPVTVGFKWKVTK